MAVTGLTSVLRTAMAPPRLGVGQANQTLPVKFSKMFESEPNPSTQRICRDTKLMDVRAASPSSSSSFLYTFFRRGMHTALACTHASATEGCFVVLRLRGLA